MNETENNFWIQTHSGKAFYPFSPKREDVYVDDIAWSLAMLCRFNGHCRSFYSVAQHSVFMSWRIQNGLAMQALFHDAAEAYLGDIAAPIKRNFPSIDGIEGKILEIIAEVIGFSLPLSEEIKFADKRMLATEKRDLMANEPQSWGILPEPYEKRIEPWDCERAQREFMRRYDMLKRGVVGYEV